MRIIGCDFRSGFQQIAWLEEETGEYGQARLQHREEAEQFWPQRVRTGGTSRDRASGGTRWFERLLAELRIELWFGGPAKIRVQEVRKQKTDARDADLILKLLREGRFSKLWAPSPQQREERQLLLHRQRLVQMRTRVKNQS